MVQILKNHNKDIHGMVHCSGGAQTKILHFINQNHIIKDNMFDIPPLFKLIQNESKTPWEEMYKVFNMGHRMEIYTNPKNINSIVDICKEFNLEAKQIGRVEMANSKKLTISSKMENLFMSDQSLLNKLEQISYKYDEITKQMVDPAIISDMKRYVILNREYKELSEIVKVYYSYKDILANIENAKLIIQTEKDLEFKDMAREELEDLQKSKLELDEKIKWLLIPKDPDDNKNVIMEIRAGTGGDEACIFVEDIFRMFTMYFKEKSWSYNVLNSNEGGTKGFREISLSISGEEVYGKLKFESGVHRVQRVPETESQGEFILLQLQ